MKDRQKVRGLATYQRTRRRMFHGESYADTFFQDAIVISIFFFEQNDSRREASGP